MEPVEDRDLGGSRQRPRQDRAAQTARPRKTSSSRGLVLLLAVAAILGFVALQPQVGAGLSQLLGRFQGGAAKPSPQPSLADRVEAIESALQPIELRQDLVEARLGQVENQVRQRPAAADGSSAPGGAADSRLAKLADEVAKLREEVDAVHHLGSDAASAGRLSAAIEKTEAAVARLAGHRENPALFLLAVGHLREAADRGTPFEPQLRTAAQLGGQHFAAALPLLEPFAAKGVATKALLLEQLRQATAIAQREAAESEGNWLVGRALQVLDTVITVRRVAGEAGGIAATLAQANRLMAAGDVVAALAASRSVSGAGRGALAPWIESAGARVAVDAVISEMAAAALAQAATVDE